MKIRVSEEFSDGSTSFAMILLYCKDVLPANATSWKLNVTKTLHGLFYKPLVHWRRCINSDRYRGSMSIAVCNFTSIYNFQILPHAKHQFLRQFCRNDTDEIDTLELYNSCQKIFHIEYGCTFKNVLTFFLIVVNLDLWLNYFCETLGS